MDIPVAVCSSNTQHNVELIVRLPPHPPRSAHPGRRSDRSPVSVTNRSIPWAPTARPKSASLRATASRAGAHFSWLSLVESPLPPLPAFAALDGHLPRTAGEQQAFAGHLQPGVRDPRRQKGGRGGHRGRPGQPQPPASGEGPAPSPPHLDPGRDASTHRRCSPLRACPAPGDPRGSALASGRCAWTAAHGWRVSALRQASAGQVGVEAAKAAGVGCLVRAPPSAPVPAALRLCAAAARGAAHAALARASRRRAPKGRWIACGLACHEPTRGATRAGYKEHLLCKRRHQERGPRHRRPHGGGPLPSLDGGAQRCRSQRMMWLAGARTCRDSAVQWDAGVRTLTLGGCLTQLVCSFQPKPSRRQAAACRVSPARIS